MAEQRSLGARLTLIAYESWTAEPTWRAAVIVALVGSIAFSLNKPPIKPPTNKISGQHTAPPPAFQSAPSLPVNSGVFSATTGNQTSIKIKPKMTTENLDIEQKEIKKEDFAKIYGE